MKYKHILWIDDCDINDGNVDDDFLEIEEGCKKNGSEYIDTLNTDSIIEEYFHSAGSDIQLVRDYNEALAILENNNFNYDLIIFDVNMTNGLDILDLNAINKHLSSKGVDTTNITHDKFPEFLKSAGIYLYYYLLHCGYSYERMVFLTGNYTSQCIEYLKEAKICVNQLEYDYDAAQEKFIPQNTNGNIPNLLAKVDIKKDKDSTWINFFYKNKYYQVRRLVFKACEYWKERLENLASETQIPFNEIYYATPSSNPIEIASFINMLEKIKMLFPVAEPTNSESIYYQALQIATMFHEENANITLLDIPSSPKKASSSKNYHQAVRFFRNWSAHNKFPTSKINADLFSYVFCLTLRTYFQRTTKVQDDPFVFITDINNGNESKEIYDTYEKEFFDVIKPISYDEQLLKQYYLSAIKKHTNSACNYLNSNKKTINYKIKDINHLLAESGKCPGTNVLPSDVLIPIMDHLLSLVQNQNNIILNVPSSDADVTLEYNITYNFKMNWDKNFSITNISSDNFKNNNLFKALAYNLFYRQSS